MKLSKIKIGLMAFILSAVVAGASSVSAQDELWRPDKQTGVMISPEDCLKPQPIQCGLWYKPNESEPYAVELGEFIGE